MIWRVEIKHKQGVFDAFAAGINKDIHDLGLTAFTAVEFVHVFTIEGTISASQIKRIAGQLLADPITQDYTVLDAARYSPPAEHAGKKVVEIAYHPGVMDPVEESTIKGIRDLGITAIQTVHTSRQYHLHGSFTQRDINLVVDKVLANKLIQHVVQDFTAHLAPPAAATDGPVKVITVDVLEANERRLKDISRTGQLFLNRQEMRSIQKYFRRL